MKLNNTYIFWNHTSVLSTVAVGLLVSHLPGCSIRPPGAPWGLAPHPSDVIRSVDNPHHFNDNDWSFFMARPILTYYFSPPRAVFNFYVLSPFKCCPGSWSRQRTMKSIEACIVQCTQARNGSFPCICFCSQDEEGRELKRSVLHQRVMRGETLGDEVATSSSLTVKWTAIVSTNSYLVQGIVSTNSYLVQRIVSTNSSTNRFNQ